MKEVLAWVESLGPWGPAAFIALYALATVLFVPGSILTLGAGALFGLARGYLYVAAGSMLGASGAFLIGRYAARDWVARKVAGNPRFQAIDEAVGREGWKIVALARLSPVFPFNLLNYAFGLTGVSFRQYFWTSLVGMMPGTVMYVYAGALAGDLAALGAGRGERTPGQWALTVAGFIATAAVTVHVTRIAKRALREKAR